MKILYKNFNERLSVKLFKSYSKSSVLKKVPDLENFIKKSINLETSIIKSDLLKSNIKAI